jgi:hypothetical protein
MCQPLRESELSPEDSRLAPQAGPPRLKLYTDYEQTFSEWEAMFLCAIVNSTRSITKHVHRIYWCNKEDMIAQFGEDLYQRLLDRGAIQTWYHHEGFEAVTLTPWCAHVLGFRISEYWVRHIDRIKEYRGVGRRLARIRVQRWDTEPYWTYCDRPERPIRVPSNTCELPLIGDPEDQRYNQEIQEYLEDWQTWTFTKNPRKAITITIRVGSFAHKVIIKRDKGKRDRKPKTGHKK